MQEIKFDPANNAPRWVACFDLLGMSNLIQTGNLIHVFGVYSQAMERAMRECENLSVRHAWFSDTFILYSENDSASDFVEIDHVARWFMYSLVTNYIPARGAIACGNFYADERSHLYFGGALVEAYEYGDAQNWIGFLLCPSAEDRLKKVGLPANERTEYAYWNVPLKDSLASITVQLPCCIMGRWISINGENLFLTALQAMKQRQRDPGIIRKYDNSINFIQSNSERWYSVGDFALKRSAPADSQCNTPLD